jgi:hypothetical protein
MLVPDHRRTTMPRIPSSASAATPDPRLSRTLWQWLVLGALLLALFPDARGYGEWLGWRPFWAVIAPSVALVVLHRQVLAAAWRSFLVRAPRRRRPRGTQAQMRRSGFGSTPRRQPLRAA